MLGMFISSLPSQNALPVVVYVSTTTLSSWTFTDMRCDCRVGFEDEALMVYK